MLTTLSIIALPSLGYDPFASWQYDASVDPFMWLRDSLPGLVPGAQVSLYGYDAHPHSNCEPISIQDIAISLISGLRGIGRSALSAKPVVFPAHSLGGVVLKQCLIELANAGQTQLFMLRTVKACIFLAVPNCLPPPSELSMIANCGRLRGLLEDLQAARNVGYLSSMSGMLGGIAQANGIRLFSGFETVCILRPAVFTSMADEHRQRRTELQAGKGKSVLLLQEHESIQPGSESSDVFPVPRSHQRAAGFQPNDPTIGTIAAYTKDSIEATHSIVAEPPNPMETRSWKDLGSRLGGFMSYFSCELFQFQSPHLQAPRC